MGADSQPEIPSGEFAGSLAWHGADLPEGVSLLPIDDESAAELAAAAAQLADNPLPILALDPFDFPLAACQGLMKRAAHRLSAGPGFVVLDRIDIARHGRGATAALAWLLARLLARPVAQKWDGTMVYDVRDMGRPPGNGVRPDITNAEQNFHVDNSYNLCPPDYVALVCLQTAMQGGVSGLVSFQAAHNAMRRRYPGLLSRLYRPFLFDRQGEHAPGEAMTLRRPIFEWDGQRLQGRISRFQILNGHVLAGEPLDAKGQDALDAFNGIMDLTRLRFDFVFKPGQVQIVRNRLLAHKRTAFQDWPEPERKRHLVRLWLRDGGRPFYNG